MDFELNDSVTLVTGAGRGLGRAAVDALVAEGARVAAVARDPAAVAELEAIDPERVAGFSCDMRDDAELAALPQQAVERFGRLDAVVNNAGIAPAGQFVEQDQEVFDDVMAINVRAPAILSRAAGRIMLAQGSGKIVNIASTSGLLGKPTLVAYSASKGAILQFTKALAAEWAQRGVQVNAIAPGAFETDAQRAVTENPKVMERRLRKIPAARMGDPSEIGPLVCLLCSPLSSYVTGSVFVADGGESSKL